MRTDKGHKIKQIEQGSIAQQEGICAGDSLLSINGTVMEDIFDYQYQVQNDHVELVLLEKRLRRSLIRMRTTIWGLFLKTDLWISTVRAIINVSFALLTRCQRA